MSMLLDQRGIEFTVAEEINEDAAAKGGNCAMEVLDFLLNQHCHESTITSQIVKAAEAIYQARQRNESEGSRTDMVLAIGPACQ